MSTILFGCGGGGCNIVSDMCHGMFVETVNVSSSRPTTILLESDMDDCRGDPVLGWTLASEKEALIKEKICAHSNVMAVCVLGGGVGSGSLSVILKAARSLRTRSVAVVGLPFSVENERRSKALDQLNAVIHIADRTLIFDMDRYMDAIGNADAADMLTRINRMMCDSMMRVSEMMDGPFFSIFIEKAYTIAYDDSMDPEKAALSGMIKGFTDSDPSHGKMVISTDADLSDIDNELIRKAVCDQTGILPEIVSRKSGSGHGVMEFIPVAYRSL